MKEATDRNAPERGSPRSPNSSAAHWIKEALSSRSAADVGAGAPARPPEADEPSTLEELIPDELSIFRKKYFAELG
jgi:hypothetical protein